MLNVGSEKWTFVFSLDFLESTFLSVWGIPYYTILVEVELRIIVAEKASTYFPTLYWYMSPALAVLRCALQGGTLTRELASDVQEHCQRRTDNMSSQVWMAELSGTASCVGVGCLTRVQGAAVSSPGSLCDMLQLCTLSLHLLGPVFHASLSSLLYTSGSYPISFQ